METKHTKEYAEQLAKEAFPESSFGSRDFEIAIENSKIGFKQGYMRAIEETAAPDLLEALNSLVKKYEFNLNQSQKKNIHLDEEYNKSINAINKATK